MTPRSGPKERERERERSCLLRLSKKSIVPLLPAAARSGVSHAQGPRLCVFVCVGDEGGGGVPVSSPPGEVPAPAPPRNPAGLPAAGSPEDGRSE